MNPKCLAPSLICMDLCNLERDVTVLGDAGCRMLHVDLLDGYFSPSMPIGIDVVRQLRRKTDMLFDAHVMAVQNDFFVDQLVEIGADRICFQAETERHVCRKLSRLKAAGVEAGVALSPATSLDCLEYALELCDFVLLMMINPGYASFGGEARYSFMPEKVRKLGAMIAGRGLKTGIEVDGRVGVADMENLMAAGAGTFVLGTTCLSGGASLGDSFRKVLEHLSGLQQGGAHALQ